MRYLRLWGTHRCQFLLEYGRHTCLATANIPSNHRLQVSIRQFADPEARLAELCSTIPMKRPTEPEDVALAAVYLASDEASFITGTLIEVDGGRGV